MRIQAQVGNRPCLATSKRPHSGRSAGLSATLKDPMARVDSG